MLPPSSSTFLSFALVSWPVLVLEKALCSSYMSAGSRGAPVPGSGLSVPCGSLCLQLSSLRTGCGARNSSACRLGPILPPPCPASFCFLVQNTILWKTNFLSGLALYLPIEHSVLSLLPCKLLGPVGPARCPFIIRLKISSSVLERRLKEMHKRQKTLVGTRKSKGKNSEDTKGDFNLQAHFLVENKPSMRSAR